MWSVVTGRSGTALSFLGGAQESGPVQKGAAGKDSKAERKSAHQQCSPGKMEKIGPICGLMLGKIDSVPE